MSHFSKLLNTCLVLMILCICLSGVPGTFAEELPDQIVTSQQLNKNEKTASVASELQATIKMKESGFVPIIESFFPDQVFRDFVLENDLNRDGSLNIEEAETVIWISLSYSSIKSLQGIDVFTNLLYLDCSNNKLKSLDLRNNLALETLNCSYNKLKELNISNCSRIDWLDISYNKLNPEELSFNQGLSFLACAGLNLSDVDISPYYNLKHFRCEDNNLTELDLTHNPNLWSLSCYGNRIRVLDVSSVESLSLLLQSSDYERNGGYHYDHFIIIGHYEDGDLYCDPYTTIIAGDYVSKPVSNLRKFPDKEPEVTQELEDIPIDEQHFPDAAFRKVIKKFDNDPDGILDEDELIWIKTIGCSDMDIEDLTGIEFFPELTSLRCDRNPIKKLDVSKNKKLRSLECSECKLTALELSGNPDLEDLWCGFNLLTSLDMSGNHKLRDLFCNSNQLSSLILTDNPALIRLDCQDNPGLIADLSGLSEIRDLNCDGCGLKSLDVSRFSKLESLHCVNNALQSIDLSGLHCLNWLCCHHNNLSNLDLSENPEVEYLLCRNNQFDTLDVSNCPVLCDTIANKKRLAAPISFDDDCVFFKNELCESESNAITTGSCDIFCEIDLEEEVIVLLSIDRGVTIYAGDRISRPRNEIK